MIYSANQFKQKKRCKAYQITDVAINKVPNPRIIGFSEEQNLYIQNLHKIVLGNAKKLNSTHNTNEMEVGMLVDIHSWEHWLIEGNRPREVEVKQNIEAYKKLLNGYKNQLMFIHNHPSTGTFSGEDFKMFCYHNSLYVMSVVGNDSSIYILTKTPEFDAEKALADYFRLARKYHNDGHIKNNGTLAIREILKNAKKYGIIYKKGRK